MSERDLKRIEVLTEVLAGRRTVVSAAAVLTLGVRQTFRLLARYQKGGGGALIHQARGRASNRQWNSGVRKYAVELVRSKYADFGPTLATEVLLGRHSIKVGREALVQIFLVGRMRSRRRIDLGSEDSVPDSGRSLVFEA
jgi:hypothetical protein